MDARDKMHLKIKVRDLYLLIGWFFCYAPPILYRISGGVTIIRFGSIICFLLLLISKKRKIAWNIHDGLKTAFTLFLLWSAACVLIQSPKEITNFTFEYLLPCLNMLLLVNKSLEKGLEGIVALYWLSVIYIVLNFISILLFPNGLFVTNVGSAVERANWLLGSKNNQSIYLVLTTTVCILFSKKSFRGKFWCVLFMTISLITILITGENGIEFMGGSSTGLISILFLFVVGILYLNFDRISFLNHAFLTYFIAILALNLIIILSTSIPLLQKFVVDILHKDMTFSNRTLIWQAVLARIAARPLWGYGETQLWFSVRLSSWLDGTTYVYNLILKILIDFGIIGFCLFCAVFFQLPYKKGNRHYYVMIAGLIAFFLCGLMDEVEFQYLFLFPAVMRNYFKVEAS